MAEKQKKAVFGSLQPDVDPLLELNDLTAADFAPATSGEKEDFIQQRKSVSYWADAWRRLRKNVVAMVALGVIVLLVLFAFVGPMLVPYGYDQFNAGAENLYPWHYSLEAQQAYKEATSSQDPDEAVAAAEAEAAARGEELSSKDKALIRAQAKAGGGAEYEGMSEEEIYKALGYSAQPFGYSNDELQRIADGREGVSPCVRHRPLRPRYHGAHHVCHPSVHDHRPHRRADRAGHRCALRLHLRLLRRHGGRRHAAHR